MVIGANRRRTKISHRRRRSDDDTEAAQYMLLPVSKVRKIQVPSVFGMMAGGVALMCLVLSV
ncbi:hypothetical protein BVC80_1689g32 [Macleaya cordata]|uniref:Uncharacterized protein n=1 Tax=Macleaya cordata TaxID=56857 RepID=A0A200RAV5_MACCD|nr:hypothetical protein BVC80_1689g32 [Macleaya cordata]